MSAPAQQATTGSDPKQVPTGAATAARAAAEKLGTRTVILAMDELLGITDAFVLTSGRNSRQVRTLVEEVEKEVKRETGMAPLSVEGLRDLHWVLIDYGDFVVHVFHEDTRDYYDLEHLWGDAPRIDWDVSTHNGHGNRSEGRDGPRLQ